MKKLLYFAVILTLLFSCAIKQSVIRNIDNNAPVPQLKDNIFVFSEYAKDSRYGYNPEYPINCFFKNSVNDTINQQRFLNALTGPKGEKLFFKKLESCCVFPTKNSEMGTGFLDVYEISYVGLAKPIKIYLNIYERGKLMVPIGLELKK